MKIEIISLTEKARERIDYCDSIEIKINGIEMFSVYDGEPEDNTLNRNFRSCYNILPLIEMAYNAGKAGEKLEIERLEVDEI